MKRYALLLAILIYGASAVEAQISKGPAATKPAIDSKAANAAAAELAKQTFAAHGGDKFRAVKTMVIRGSVDLTSSAFNQAIAGAFSMAFAGDKYRLEIANPVQSFKQTYDGTETRTSVPTGFSLPPVNRLGFPLLQKLGDEGFVVSSLPEDSKKKLGFRITAPDGYFTDFFVDEKTKQIKSFEAMYEFSGRMFTTSVEVSKYREVAGVWLPEKYSQRFDLGQLTVYGDFKSKDILINTELAPDVFTSVK